MKMFVRNKFLIILLSESITLLSFFPVKKVNMEKDAALNFRGNSVESKTKSFSGCLVFKTSYNHYKKTANIPLTLNDFTIIKSLKDGKRASEKFYNKKMFTKKIIISRKVEQSDTSATEYKRIETILKKYE